MVEAEVVSRAAVGGSVLEHFSECHACIKACIELVTNIVTEDTLSDQ